jgi:hypothetical protein
MTVLSSMHTGPLVRHAYTNNVSIQRFTISNKFFDLSSVDVIDVWLAPERGIRVLSTTPGGRPISGGYHILPHEVPDTHRAQCDTRSNTHL